MKITKERLRQIIKEELAQAMEEGLGPVYGLRRRAGKDPDEPRRTKKDRYEKFYNRSSRGGGVELLKRSKEDLLNLKSETETDPTLSDAEKQRRLNLIDLELTALNQDQ